MSKKKDDSSWKGMSEKYKNSKKEPILNEDEHISSKKKKKKKKNKRSKHKHIYVPAIYHRSYINHNGEKHYFDCCGSHCKICGRINSMRYLWSHSEEQLERFKKEYPNYIEVTLPENFDWFKDKHISL